MDERFEKLHEQIRDFHHEVGQYCRLVHSCKGCHIKRMNCLCYYSEDTFCKAVGFPRKKPSISFPFFAYFIEHIANLEFELHCENCCYENDFCIKFRDIVARFDELPVCVIKQSMKQMRLLYKLK